LARDPFPVYLSLDLGPDAAYDRPRVQWDRMFFPGEKQPTLRSVGRPELAAR
jgi:hypothetical protein